MAECRLSFSTWVDAHGNRVYVADCPWRQSDMICPKRRQLPITGDLGPDNPLIAQKAEVFGILIDHDQGKCGGPR